MSGRYILKLNISSVSASCAMPRVIPLVGPGLLQEVVTMANCAHIQILARKEYVLVLIMTVGCLLLMQL